MVFLDISYPSFNDRDEVYAWINTPVGEAPLAIVHLVHGLGEHSGRYQRLVTELVENGIAVVANDHVGHGRTAMRSEIWKDTGETGWQTYVEDERELARQAMEFFPDAAYYMLGHSWGSLIARAYTQKYGGMLDGLILTGPVEQMLGAKKVNRKTLQKQIDAGKGADKVTQRYLKQLFAGVNDRFGEFAHPNAWLCTDDAVVYDHEIDPFNGSDEIMSYRFLKDFLDLYDAVTSANIADTWPAELSVLLLAGDKDPVGNYGEGVYHLANKLIEGGVTDVHTQVIPGIRHEVLNEPKIKKNVVNDILMFIMFHTVGPILEEEFGDELPSDLDDFFPGSFGGPGEPDFPMGGPGFGGPGFGGPGFGGPGFGGPGFGGPGFGGPGNIPPSFLRGSGFIGDIPDTIPDDFMTDDPDEGAK
ncbi:alpha/beta fold hydrolase [Trueperella bialowiezensis]|uniref:alpha/beta fold hydrolase n=1 Tax=Trueperella bialowiezensis TaxID=312285 RepID=UPI0013DF0D59|nr:alpha/beta fold hydrolase [Trueperella bialowiezensis]